MAHDPSAFIQEYFRIRSGDDTALNTDSGWAAIENANATIGTGLEFRIRFKVRETAAGTDTTSFKLQVNRNSGGWVDLDVLGGVAAPAAQAVLSSQYVDGDATSTELLTNTGTYVNGTGEEDNITGSFTLTSEETEFEFCIMLMSFHDGPTQNVDGDTLEFRVVESDGTVFTGTYTNPTITISETPGYIGGTYPETPCKIGPYVDANGNIYVLIEPAESQNDPIMIKSTDGGDTWREMDGAGRPTTNDLEGLDVVQVGDTLHILHQEGSEVVFHRFTMSDHATTDDEWTIIDEAVDTVTTTSDQVCTLAVLADGSIRGFYADGGSPMRVFYKTRSTGGTWGSRQTLDTEASKNFIAPFCVMGENDLVHVIYKDDTLGEGEIFHRSLNSSDTLSARESIASGVDTGSTSDRVPFVPPVYWDSSGEEKIMILYQITGEKLFAKVITDDGSPSSQVTMSDLDVERNEGGNHMVIAHAALDGTVVHVVYSELSVMDGWHGQEGDEGGWGTDVEILPDVTMHWVKTNVFTHSPANGGNTVLGIVWDNGSDGGTGRIFYDEVVLATPALLTRRRLVTPGIV